MTWLFMGCMMGMVFASNVSARTVVPYCVDPNWLPYEGIEDGQHVGMSSDYIRLLNEQTPYQFELVVTQDWQQSKAYLKQGRCGLLPMLNQTPERETFLDFSEVFFSSPNFLVSDDQEPFLQSFESIGERTLGVTAGYRISQYVAEHYPAISTRTYDTEQQGLLAVANGEVDFFVGSVHSVNNHIQTLGLTNLKIAGWGGPDDELRMGVAKGQQPLLQAINEAISRISRQQHFEIYNRWNNVKVIDNTNYQLIWQVLTVTLMLFGLFLIRYFSIKKYNQDLTTKNNKLSDLQRELLQTNAELQAISQRDSLTKLYNRHHFNQLISNQVFSLDDGPLCLIFVDLDWFKQINDQHGHVTGDQVLRAFADILRQCCGHHELVCRWGGEEFVIIQQPATLEDAEMLCQQIQSALAEHRFAHGEEVTCSFGVAQLRPEEDLLGCFERADQMLYQAKDDGRNCIAASA